MPRACRSPLICRAAAVDIYFRYEIFAYAAVYCWRRAAIDATPMMFLRAAAAFSRYERTPRRHYSTPLRAVIYFRSPPCYSRADVAGAALLIIDLRVLT